MREPLGWNRAVFRLVHAIPRGKVATYGQIARLLGRPRGAREVGWALHVCADRRVPCHRVVTREGRCAPHFAGRGPQAQRQRLAKEGVTFAGGMVDLARHHWEPTLPPPSSPLRIRAVSRAGSRRRRVRS